MTLEHQENHMIAPAAGIINKPAPVFTPSPEATAMRAEFNRLDLAVQKAMMAMRDAPLPDFWDDPHCVCEPDDVSAQIQVVTPGYVQWCDVDWVDSDTKVVHANTDGWDDMSDDGFTSYLECQGCHTMWALPDGIEWD